MFDFAFSEVLVICVVALVVLGPTRLPGVVRKLGRWIGKARAMARDFRQQLENEVTLEELNRMTGKQTRQNQAAAAAGAATAPGAAGTDTVSPASADASMAGTGYPYGAPPAEASGSSPELAPAGDTSVAQAEASTPGPGDDTYSHAHAEGAAPELWTPESAPAHHAANVESASQADPSLAAEPPPADAERAHS